ncbi:MAG: hypothetical protein ACRD47_16765 [Nitrososphaeraceae archaeon]
MSATKLAYAALNLIGKHQIILHGKEEYARAGLAILTRQIQFGGVIIVCLTSILRYKTYQLRTSASSE